MSYYGNTPTNFYAACSLNPNHFSGNNKKHAEFHNSNIINYLERSNSCDSYSSSSSSSSCSSPNIYVGSNGGLSHNFFGNCGDSFTITSSY